ncbi:hypothetical protein DFH29DRAFT_1005353 [Suillus ampliporus]|nr:hypothetical protein DFH29DRAFT_1005353 [Suillus ampliporus]
MSRSQQRALLHSADDAMVTSPSTGPVPPTPTSYGYNGVEDEDCDQYEDCDRYEEQDGAEEHSDDALGAEDGKDEED